MSVMQSRSGKGRSNRRGIVAMQLMRKTIDTYLKHLGRERHYSPHTVAAYEDDLLQFDEFLHRHYDGAKIDLSTIDHLTIRCFLGDLLDRGLSKTTAARKLAAIRSWFKFLLRRKMITQSPAVHVATPRLPRKLPSFLSESS